MDLVSPVTMGTGINVKTVQAMAYGMPLLTTSWGSKGIETGDPMDCHANMDALTESLMTVFNNPSELKTLYRLRVCERYDRFDEAGMNAMRSLSRHQKLTSCCGSTALYRNDMLHEHAACLPTAGDLAYAAQ